MKKLHGIHLLFLVLLLVFGVTVCFAENFPSSKITIIIQAAPGGAADLTARTMADLMSRKLKVPVVGVNMPGGAGAIAMSYVAKSKPDGYTIGMMVPELAMVKALGYSDLEPKNVALLGRLAIMSATVTVKKDAPYNTLAEFIEYAKAHPGQVKAGNSGTGSTWHFAAVALEGAAGVKFNHVPFDGAAPAVAALMGGHIDMVAVSPMEVKAGVEGGYLKILAIIGDEKSRIFPDIKTTQELGIKNLNFMVWLGLGAPKGLPDNVKETLTATIEEAAKSDQFSNMCKTRGLTPAYMTPTKFTEFADQQYDFYSKTIPTMGISTKK